MNTQAELDPINLVIHRQARQIWDTLEGFLPADILGKLEVRQGNRFKKDFPSSRNKTIEPAPIY